MNTYRDQFNEADEAGLRGATGEIGRLYLAEFMLQRMSPPPKAKILDLGCGDGRVLAAIKRLRPDLDCVGVDFAEKKIAEAVDNAGGQQGLSFHVRDLTQGELDLGLFDRICSFSVVQYLQPEQFAGLNTRLLTSLAPGAELFHLSIPDLSKRTVLFQDAFLNQQPRSRGAALFNLLKMAAVDVRRRWSGDHRYGDSLFHDATLLAHLVETHYKVETLRPSDSWYRFDLKLARHPK